MPDKDGYVTTADRKAPAGRYRIMRESMEDGELAIIADVNKCDCASKIANWLSDDDEDSIFSVWDEHGNEI